MADDYNQIFTDRDARGNAFCIESPQALTGYQISEAIKWYWQQPHHPKAPSELERDKLVVITVAGSAGKELRTLQHLKPIPRYQWDELQRYVTEKLRSEEFIQIGQQELKERFGIIAPFWKQMCFLAKDSPPKHSVEPISIRPDGEPSFLRFGR